MLVVNEQASHLHFMFLLFEFTSPSQPDLTFLNGDCSLRIIHQFSRGHVCSSQTHCEDFDLSGAGRVFKTEDVFQAPAARGNNNSNQATHLSKKQFQQPEPNRSVSSLSDINKLQRSLLQKQSWPFKSVPEHLKIFNK